MTHAIAARNAVPPQFRPFAGPGGLPPEMMQLLMRYVAQQMQQRGCGCPPGLQKAGAGGPLTPDQKQRLGKALKGLKRELKKVLRELTQGQGAQGAQGAQGGAPACGPRPAMPRCAPPPVQQQAQCAPRPVQQQAFCAPPPVQQQAFCAPPPVQQQAFCAPPAQATNNVIKGSEKGGWLASHKGGYKKVGNDFEILKGKWAGHKAINCGSGKFQIVDKQGVAKGTFNAPGGKNKIASPLMFDLNGNGKVDTTGIEGGKKFDLNGDGKVDKTAWAGKGDGVLAFDRNGDGKAGTDGRELFGNNTDLDGDGKADGFANGFQALRGLAEKHLGKAATADGKLDAKEIAALEKAAGLKMNVDGADRSLAELGITELDLSYAEAGKNADANGNEHRQVGAGFTQNGQRRAVNDVWLQYQ
jgi:hypothetical protein